MTLSFRSQSIRSFSLHLHHAVTGQSYHHISLTVKQSKSLSVFKSNLHTIDLTKF